VVRASAQTAIALNGPQAISVSLLSAASLRKLSMLSTTLTDSFRAERVWGWVDWSVAGFGGDLIKDLAGF
jgi:hypothetical protein